MERRRASSASETSEPVAIDRKSTRLNSSHSQISYAVFCLKKKKNTTTNIRFPATCRTCPNTVHRMEVKTFITCTIHRHTKILIAVAELIIRLVHLFSLVYP